MVDSIELFSNEMFGSLRTVVIDGEPWFVAKDLAQVLGYNQTENLYKIIDSRDKCNIDPQSPEYQGFFPNGRTTTIQCLEPNKNVRIMTIINESGFYKAMFASKLPAAVEFTRWVTSEIMPRIRRTGGYISPDATEEQVDCLAKFHSRKISKTFEKCKYEDFADLYKEFIEYMDTAKLQHKDRVPLLESVRKGIQRAYEDSDDFVVKHARLTMLQTVNKDYEWSKNYKNGTEKRVLTNKVKRLAAENDVLKKTACPSPEDFVTINCHGFTSNCIRNRRGTGFSKDYFIWRKLFPNKDLPPIEHWEIGPDDKIEVFIRYKARPDMDIDNLNKATIDAVFQHYGLDDNRVDVVHGTRWGNCEDFRHGKIFFFMRPKALE